MKAIEELQQWFESGKDYETGVFLYHQLGYSLVLKKLFAKGPNNYTRPKLESELKKILAKNSEKKVVKPKIKKVVVQTKQSENRNNLSKKQNNDPVQRFSEPQVQGYVYEDLPDQLKYETQYRIRLFKEANAHHYRLDSLEDPIQIKASCKIILENFDKIQELWERLDYYLKYKIVLPETEKKTNVKDISKLDPFELIKKRNNLRSNLTKNRKKLITLKETNKINLINQKIAHWEIELSAIDEKIKGNE
ncbi:MAG: hypothetical protein J5I47_13380 [Vicingus serpentipes]|nr:hypothetical protein [Vicingus serpentipes]